MLRKIKLGTLIVVVLLFSLVQFGLAQEEGFELKEVVVTATKTPHLLKDIPVETIVITRDNIENSNALTLPQLLRTVPGINIIGENAPGESSWRSKIRGLSFDDGYALILIDGERVKGGGMGEYGISLNQIPLDMIKKVEIVKGPASVLYGSDALAGVINVITKAVPTRCIYGAELAYGSFETFNGSLNFGNKFGKFGFFLNGNREQSTRSKYGGSEDEYKADHFMGKFGYTFSENSNMGLKVIYDDQHWEYEDDNKIRVSPDFKIKFSDVSDLTIKGYWYRWYLDSHSPGYTKRYGPTIYTQGEAQYNSPIGEKQIITVGTEYLDEDIELNVGDQLVDKKRTTTSLYLQDEIKFIESLTLILGGRMDSNSQYGTEFNPKGNLLLKITDNTRIRTSIGKAFKSPTIRQLYVFFKHGGWWNKPVADLAPEKSIGYSIGLEHLFSEKLISNFTLFRNDINDMVVRIDTAEKIDGIPVRTWKNIGEACTQGIEIQLRSQPIKGLSLNIGYTYLDTKDIETGKKLPYNPSNTANLTVLYDWRKLGLTFGIENGYIGEMYKDTGNTQKINSYSITNARISKNITGYAKISLEGENLLNSDYGEPTREWLGTTYLCRVTLNF